MLRAFLAFVVLTTPALAGNCNVAPIKAVHAAPYVATQAVHYNAYAPAVVLKQASPVLYWTVGQQVQENAQLALLRKAIREEIRQEFKARYQRSNPPDPQTQKAVGLQLLERSCMKCHQPGSKAVVEQEAPVFFTADGVFDATPELRGSIATAVKKGVMPPPPTDALDDDSYLAIKQFLSGR